MIGWKKVLKKAEREVQKMDIKNKMLKYPKTYVLYYKGCFIINEENHYSIVDAYTGEWYDSADTVQEAKSFLDLMEECPFN